MAKERLRVLLVDDDPHLRDAIAVKLGNEGYDVRTEADGRAFEEALDNYCPALVILDVRLPFGPNGYELGRALRTRSDLPLLYLSAADSVTDRLEGFGAGADDYLSKPFAMSELIARVEALLRRAGRLPSSVYRVADLEVRPAQRHAQRGGTKLDLTRKEFDLLCALIRHPGQVMSKDSLLGQVWGYEIFDTNVVEVHVSALRRKLEIDGPRLVHTERGIGYVLRP